MSPKTITGEELDLDDAPAREADLFLVDGNNLAYRAYFALPEELVTSDGFPTNALLGFTNMLVKLLSDYRPRGVAVAWDTKPVHRTAISGEYKSDRRPMPDLLREQFPYFRPIVEAFGYRNLEFEGWEADDVIATLATRADEAGVPTCVVSTDRDAFQLVTDNVCLMMTPRGVADVHVYTPERVTARLGVPPEKVPDLIGLKGDSSDSIAGVPGIGDKTAAQLIQQFDSVEGVLEHVDELSPGRAKSLREHADQARESKVLATMRRDLDIDCDPAELVLAPPDRSELQEMFRRFEFRALLQRVDQLDEALPAAEAPVVAGEELPWREASVPEPAGAFGYAADDGRCAVALSTTRSSSRRGPSASKARSCAHDAKPLRVRGGRTTRCSPRISSSRAARSTTLDRPRRRVRHRARPLAAGRGGDGGARPPRGAAAAARAAHARAARGARPRPALRGGRAAADRRARRDGGRGRPHRHVPHGGDHGAPPGSDRGARRRARTSSRARSSWSARRSRSARVLFEQLGLTPGPKGKTGYSTDTKVLQTIRDEHEIVPVIEEWRELTKLVNTYLGPLPEMIGQDGRLHTTINQAVAATGRLSTSNPNLQAIPIRTELGREIRSAFVAEEGSRLALRRLLADRAAHPRARLRRAEAQGGVRGRRGHPRGHGCGGARQGARRRSRKTSARSRR